ncbi:MAG: helix-turn-helix domain-containing protein [Spiribacter salinus]|uniref:Helix-turn-helix domain-containing protein n=1 Tax=Spiribacter salinus TaxID=1335746 RepID=A0A540VSS9_9GAMM|nr:MAG: helix-turn-helix domain-containing protein [Spiribacter salinus]
MDHQAAPRLLRLHGTRHTLCDLIVLDPHESAEGGLAGTNVGRSALTTEPWATLQEVAEHLKVSEDTVHRWISSRAMPAHRIGRVWRFKLSQIDAWVESGQANESAYDGEEPQ